jgi:ketosteroid isomerase-like protein
MTVDDLMAKQAIAEGLYRYCRSLDRMDRGLYGKVFEAGAQLDYGAYFEGTAEQFCEWVWYQHEGMQAHSHQITNIIADVDAAEGRAASEAYVTVCLRTKPDGAGKVVDIVDRGRYLDRWRRSSDGSWQIAVRRYVSDIQQVSDASMSPPPTAVRDSTDPSYSLLG